jgi:hypothetical protein
LSKKLRLRGREGGCVRLQRNGGGLHTCELCRHKNNIE